MFCGSQIEWKMWNVRGFYGEEEEIHQFLQRKKKFSSGKDTCILGSFILGLELELHIPTSSNSHLASEITDVRGLFSWSTPWWKPWMYHWNLPRETSSSGGRTEKKWSLSSRVSSLRWRFWCVSSSGSSSRGYERITQGSRGLFSHSVNNSVKLKGEESCQGRKIKKTYLA